MKKIISIVTLLVLLVSSAFAFSGGPYMNYDLINDGTFFAKAVYGDTSLKTSCARTIRCLCGKEPRTCEEAIIALRNFLNKFKSKQNKI